MLSKMLRIVSTEFEGVKDKGGNAYMLHCLFVMNAVMHLGEEAMICALGHDLLEDTKWTAHNLYDEGFSETVVSNIITLTHRKDESYDDYIKRIAASNHVCVAIKIADLRHNSDITRLKGLTKKDFDRLEKYCRAYTYLSSGV